MKCVRFTWFVLAFSWVLGQAGCGSSLVGLDCAHGHTRCSGECVDLRSAELNCGACGVTCAADEMCIASMCTSDYDGSMRRDGGQLDDGGLGRDAGDGGVDLDGRVDLDGAFPGDGSDLDGGNDNDGADDATTADAGRPDVVLPPLCTGPGSPANCVCDLGELICDFTCVNANIDIDHCGECRAPCPTIAEPDQYFCVDGQCILNCEPPRSPCGNVCVSLQADPDNCGACGFVCISGLCEDGTCLDAPAGHVIVIGHDMSNAFPAARRLAGNAIFLPSRQIVRGLVYRQYTTTPASAGVDSVINQVQATGRTFQVPLLAGNPVVNPAAEVVPFLLSQVDVLVVAAQTDASQAELLRIGGLWARALTAFIQRGGVIVLFEGGGTNGGTYQMLEESGLFLADGVQTLTPRTVYLSATNDVVTSLVPRRYTAAERSVTFDTTEQVVVVRDETTNLPVVIHVSR